MSDGKYGRLFTEADAALIAAIAYANGYHAREQREQPPEGREALWELTLDRVDQHGLTFPADEPLFLLRASDGECAADAVAAFGRGSTAPPPFVKGEPLTREHDHAMERRAQIANAYDAMRTWRPS